MSINADCVICGRVIDLRQIRGRFSGSFPCPHCGQRVRLVMAGTSQVARRIIVGLLTIPFLEGRFGEGGSGFIVWILAMWLTFIAMGVLNVMLSGVFGYTLEPAGRTELGEADESD
jgi:predicted RNA-binding Zn-ribbon protein involved in translation (DUF1610 family)